MRALIEHSGRYTAAKMNDSSRYRMYLWRTARRDNLMCSLVYWSSNVTIEVLSTVKSIWSEALWKMSLLQWPSFMSGRQLFRRTYLLFCIVRLDLKRFTTFISVFQSFGRNEVFSICDRQNRWATRCYFIECGRVSYVPSAWYLFRWKNAHHCLYFE